MALINCSMEKRTVIVTSGQNNVTSVTLEIIPDSGYVVAARDFVAGANPNTDAINSITLSNSASSGGPQNDGSYTAGNKVIVTVDFKNNYAPTTDVVLDIDPAGEATAAHLVPVKLQGTFAVPASLNKVTFTASGVLDFASSSSTTDFYAYSNPGKTVTVMVMTIAATSGDFINEDPTIAIANSGDSAAANDYTVTRANTLDTSNRLTSVVYTITAKMPKSSRSGDVITFTGAGEDIPGTQDKIYGFSMDTSSGDNNLINRRLEISADPGSTFRIKMERGTISGSTFTIDSTDGIYVFDNTKQTIASAFEPSNSTTTYPSVIDQSDGSYNPATNPYTVDSSGLFVKDIIIPPDTTDKVYRFTIIPQGTTTVDATAVGIDTSPNPDVITFNISRVGEVYIEASYASAPINPLRSGLTGSVEYFNYQGNSKGTTKPKGLAGKQVNKQVNTYDYTIVVTDDADFHLPNQLNEFVLSDLNYTNTLNSGLISEPVITAELRATADGFNAGSIRANGEASHAHAESHETDTAIVLTEQQRDALTNKTPLSLISIRSSITVDPTGSANSEFFKIKFFTTDETPVYKSQTIQIFTDFSVAGGSESDIEGGSEGMKNTTNLTAPAVDRTKLYLKGENLSIEKWGTANMSIVKNLDTFAFTSAQSVNTLDISIGVTQGVRKFVNDLARSVGYVNDVNYSIDKQVSSGGGSYTKGNITTATTHVKFTVSGAFIEAEDLLPANFNTSNYQLVLDPSSYSSNFSGATLSIFGGSQPSATLTNGSNLNRKLTIANFTIVLNFDGALSGLSTSSRYFYNFAIIHRLSSQYKPIADIEAEQLINVSNTGLASY